MDFQTVTVRAIATSKDDNGDATSTTETTTVDRVLFEPQQAVERTDSRSPGVTSSAKFYGPFPPLDADDEVTDAAGVVWQVIGGSAVWGQESEVPVRRSAAV